jgi:hypothetical protein
MPNLPTWIGLISAFLLLTASLIGAERRLGHGRAEVWYAGELVKAPPKKSDQPRDKPDSPPRKSDSPNKLFAIRMLGEARELADMGDMQQARRLCQWASELHAQWEPDEQLPSEVLRELERRHALRQRHNQLRSTPPVVAPSPLRRLPPTETDQPEKVHEEQQEAESSRSETVNVQVNTRWTVPDQRRFEQRPSANLEAKTVRLPSDLGERLDLNGSAGQVHATGDRLRQPPPATPPQFDEAQQGVSEPSMSAALGPFLGFFLGVLVCLLLLVAGIVLLRRLGARGGALLRVELVNNGPSGLVLATAANDQHGAFASSSGTPDEQEADLTQTADGVAVYAEDVDIPLPLDSGEPTFDEVQRREEEQRKEQEQAILKNILDENVQLHEQILEAHGALA